MGLNLSNLTPEQQAIALQQDAGTVSTKPDKTLDKLAGKFGDLKRSFLERNKKYTTPALILSWVCNIASGAGLFWLVAMLFDDFPLPYGNWVIATLMLFGFEYCKREASDSFWDNYWKDGKKISWGRFAVNFGLFVASLGATLVGVHYLVTDTTAGAEIMTASQKPEAAALQASIEEKRAAITELEQQNKAARSDKSNYNRQGKFLYALVTAEGKRVARMGKLEDAITAAEERLHNEFGIVNVTNDEIRAEWRERRDVKVAFALLLCLVLEFIFEVCMAFLSLYDWRHFLLLKALDARGQLTSAPRGRKITTAPVTNGHAVLTP